MKNRKTFAIISHPDAGKTTITEQLLLLGGAINLAGTVKARKSARHVTSDWMELEKQRGISISTSVLRIKYHDIDINLLDTPGHADFSEDTYRTLTAVDSALMVIDGAKGVEARTIKLMEICRMRQIPIFTFINKLDRDGKPPFELLDEIEKVLSIKCIPINWPLGMGRNFKGLYQLKNRSFHHYIPKKNEDNKVTDNISNETIQKEFQSDGDQLVQDIELIQGAIDSFDEDQFQKGHVTPVYFGSAINNYGLKLLLNDFVKYAPNPQKREALERMVDPNEKSFSGFVFKIQANMDPRHHDRVAFLRIVSGEYNQGMKLFKVRESKFMPMKKAMNLFAQSREHTEQAYPGDIIGIHNYGDIRIGDTFTEGEKINFTGIPNFAPELFNIVRLKDPLRSKALLKGLQQLCEEGATQIFKPLMSNDVILGAVGILQFDVVAYRLKNEYGVECGYEKSSVISARWVSCDDPKMLKEFEEKNKLHLALDGDGQLTYLAPSHVHLRLTKERWPKVTFSQIREHIIKQE